MDVIAFALTKGIGDDREATPVRIYQYVAANCESGKIIAGEVVHDRPKGIELLVAILFDDLAKKTSSALNPHQKNCPSDEVKGAILGGNYEK
jgi:hypothetical protein